MNGAKVIITGASSGIGAALAERLAAPGAVIGLVARRRERLEALAERLAAREARALVYVADVGDPARMREVVDDFVRQAGGITMAIANAGLSRSDRLREGDPAPAAAMIAANVAGAINTLVPAVPHMMRARAGHLVAVGSVSGFRGIPGKGAYCASKAALKTLMDGYRPVLRPHGIHVTTICPGWVRSEMTEHNPYPMPFMVSAERAAELIVRALERRRRTYVFPWQMRWIAVPLMAVLPDRLLPNLSARS